MDGRGVVSQGSRTETAGSGRGLRRREPRGVRRLHDDVPTARDRAGVGTRVERDRAGQEDEEPLDTRDLAALGRFQEVGIYTKGARACGVTVDEIRKGCPCPCHRVLRRPGGPAGIHRGARSARRSGSAGWGVTSSSREMGPGTNRDVEPTLGLEPRTCCLRNSCSTTELCRRGRQCTKPSRSVPSGIQPGRVELDDRRLTHDQ